MSEMSEMSEFGRVIISTPEAEAEIYLQGAHIAQWTPRGHRPVLFMSSRSMFAPGKAIRGGVPVIFPWFGPRSDGQPGPAHGFARTLPWTQQAEGIFELIHEGYRLRFTVTVGASLQMELEVRNDSGKAVVFEEALHTYLSVADIRSVELDGLQGTTFIDKTDGMKRMVQPAEPIRIAKETDQVHLNTQSTCVVTDPVWNRRIVIEKTGSDSTVVWNPWIEKTAKMADMAPDEWRNMICVETANAADNAVSLEPGATHKLTAEIFIDPLQR